MDMRCRRSARSHVIFNLKLTLNLETCNMNNMTELMAHLMYSAEYIYFFTFTSRHVVYEYACVCVSSMS